jgi:DNA/RNA-binding domain of Phe-tRNA-synthetase-like protein
MHFQHSADIWRDFPALVPGVLYAEGITAIAKAQLVTGPEAELPEIQAWRRAFARMGLRPTQYRCAAESLLRRFRKEGSLPRLHPLVDLCNAVLLAFAIPVAVFDARAVAWPLEVRYAVGDEDYLTFGGDTEHPAAGEVIFADQAGQRRAHPRRAPVHVLDVTPGPRSSRQGRDPHARAATGSAPASASRAYSASCTGFGCPARPR